MSKFDNVLEKLKAIQKKKEAELPGVDPSTVDYPVLSEEIEHAKFAIKAIEEGQDEIEILMSLSATLNATTSGSIYDCIGPLFPEKYITPEQAAEKRRQHALSGLSE